MFLYELFGSPIAFLRKMYGRLVQGDRRGDPGRLIFLTEEREGSGVKDVASLLYLRERRAVASFSTVICTDVSVFRIQGKGGADHFHHLQIQIVRHPPAVIPESGAAYCGTQNQNLSSRLQKSVCPSSRESSICL